MYFEEFLQNVINVTEIPWDLEFKPAILWLRLDRLPVGVVSLGSSNSSIVRLPSHVTACAGNVVPVIAVAYWLFTNRTDITDVILPTKLERLSKNAFAGCSNLKRVTIPRTVKLINEKCFDGCDSLEDIYYDGTEEEWKQIRIVHEQILEKEPHKLGLHCQLESVIIPGNEALFRAKIHFNCSIPNSDPRELVRSHGDSLPYIYKSSSESNT